MTLNSHWKCLSNSDDTLYRIDNQGHHFKYQVSVIYTVQCNRVNAGIVDLCFLDNCKKDLHCRKKIIRNDCSLLTYIVIFNCDSIFVGVEKNSIVGPLHFRVWRFCIDRFNYIRIRRNSYLLTLLYTQRRVISSNSSFD